MRFFRTLETARRWDDAQTDHGYNGTPVWNIAGTILSNLAPASRAQILLLDSIDCGLVLGLALAGVVGFRLAGPHRRPRRLRHQFSVALVLDGGLAFALGLAVLDGRRRLPRQEGALPVRGDVPGVCGATAHLPGLRVRGSAAGLGLPLPQASPARSSLLALFRGGGAGGRAFLLPVSVVARGW